MERPEALDASVFSEDQIEDTIKLWDDVAKGQEDMVSVSSDDRPQDATEVPTALPGVELLFFNPLTCEASVRYHGQVVDLPVYLKVPEGPALVSLPDGAELATPYPPKLVGGSSGAQAKDGPGKKTKKPAAKAKQSTKQKVKVFKRPAALVEDAMKRPAASMEDATQKLPQKLLPAHRPLARGKWRCRALRCVPCVQSSLSGVSKPRRLTCSPACPAPVARVSYPSRSCWWK